MTDAPNDQDDEATQELYDNLLKQVIDADIAEELTEDNATGVWVSITYEPDDSDEGRHRCQTFATTGAALGGDEETAQAMVNLQSAVADDLNPLVLSMQSPNSE